MRFCVVGVLLLTACGYLPKDAGTQERGHPSGEWQFIAGRDGSPDAVFNPRTSMYCSFMGTEARQYCIVMAPKHAVNAATDTDTTNTH